MRHCIQVLSIALVLASAACAGRTQRDAVPVGEDAPRGRVITAEQIQKWNVLDAYDAIERAGGYRLAAGAKGEVGVQQRRGRSSIVNSAADRPLILLDNTLLQDASVLRQVRAAQIERIELLTSGDATLLYGTGAAAGAILVRTRAGIP